MNEDKAKLSVCGFTFAVGITWGLGIMFLGCISWWFGWGTDAVNAIGSVYLGYAPTALGTLIGTLWGLVDGAIGGFLIAFIYNCCLCCNKCCPKKCDTENNKET